MPVTRILRADGDPASALAYAGHPAVDAIEVDMWVHDGELFARRKTALSRLPGRPRAQDEPLDVRTLLGELAGRARLVLAVAEQRGDPAPEIARALHPLPDRSSIMLRCESREIVARLRAWLPDTDIAYSIGTERALRRHIADRISGDIEAGPLVLRHDLLHSRNEVEAARAWSGWVAAAGVDHTERARQLAAWHVDALSSRYLTVLVAV